jgi:hypothetical protein
MSENPQEKLRGGVRQENKETDYLKTVAETDVGKEYAEVIGSDIGRSHVMANRTESETEVLKWLIRFRTKMFLDMHPPKHSKMQGEVREILMGDDKTALKDDQILDVMKVQSVAISRATLGRGAKQQELIKEQRQVQRREIDESEVPDEGGTKSDLLSLFR